MTVAERFLMNEAVTPLDVDSGTSIHNCLSTTTELMRFPELRWPDHLLVILNIVSVSDFADCLY